jgi:hypothetical protein
MGDADTESLYAERMKICRQCPHVEMGIFKSPTCGLCGCKLSLKARMKNANCPVDRWVDTQ